MKMLMKFSRFSGAGIRSDTPSHVKTFSRMT